MQVAHLYEISDRRRTKAGKEAGGTLRRDDMPCTRKEVEFLIYRIYLYPRLHDVDSYRSRSGIAHYSA